MTKMALSLVANLAFGSLSACGVESVSVDSGGVDSSQRGYAVVNSDYQSVSVSLIGVDGELLSESFISSGSAEAGLSVALGGDVVLPSMPTADEELVLIDRSQAGVLTWLERETAAVRAQLNVGTGFQGNPHDYVKVSARKAYVPRFAWNLDSGKQQFDEGNDILIIDPSKPEITGRIDLMPALAGEPEGFYPAPDRAMLASGKLRVLAVGFNNDFSDRVDSRLVSIDPGADRVEHVLVFEGMHSCSTLDVSPDGTALAVACNGAFGQAPDSGYPDSGIVLVNVEATPSEVARFAAAELGGEMISSVAFVDDDTLLFTTFGRYNADLSAMEAPDTARLLDLEQGRLLGEPIHESSKLPYSLGDVSCAPAASTCAVTDAETDGGVLHYLRFADGAIDAHRMLKLDRDLGLPPRYLGNF